MKVCHHNQTRFIENGEHCQVTEHQHHDARINFSVIEINGRYPQSDRVTNLGCQELAYILEGNGTIIINGETVTLNTGDSILIDAGEKYYWQGHMKMAVSCTPAWTPEQHQKVK